jgi:RNA polymerase sigma-70 factor (ECF subfamily)
VVHPPPPSEAVLLTRACGGDLDAYEQLVRLHQQLAFRTALVLTRNAADAEEAAQDAFVKAWRALSRFDRARPFRPWLLAIVANEARNRRRSAGRRELLAVRARPEPGAALAGGSAGRGSPESSLLVAEQHAALALVLERLDERDRQVIACRYLLELSEAETAAALGCRPGTVKSRLSRALARLRAQPGIEGLDA